MKKILLIAGARPNFMKIAPIARALDTCASLSYKIVHTGQHYDAGMSQIATAPLGYMDFLHLWKDAVCVLTDSGGLQEETTALQIPCITFRETTERPITVEVGSNEVAGTDTGKIERLFSKAISGKWKKSSVPELWDGKASERIVKILGQQNLKDT